MFGSGTARKAQKLPDLLQSTLGKRDRRRELYELKMDSPKCRSKLDSLLTESVPIGIYCFPNVNGLTSYDCGLHPNFKGCLESPVDFFSSVLVTSSDALCS